MTKNDMAQMIRYFANGMANVVYPYGEGHFSRCRLWI